MFRLGSAAQNAHELYLAKARSRARYAGRWRLVYGRISKDDLLGRRTAGVAYDNGSIAVTGGAKTTKIGVLPTVRYQHTVIAKLSPVIKVCVGSLFSKGVDRGQQERQAGARCRRILHDCEISILGHREIKQRFRRLDTACG